MENRDKFDGVWDEFITTFKSQLLKASDSVITEHNYVRLLLENSKSIFYDNTSRCGKWLEDIGKENPEKAEMIRKIIDKDMDIDPVKSEELSSSFKLAVPVVGGVAGYAIAKASHATTLGLVLSTAIPLAALYPVGAYCVNRYNMLKRESVIPGYVSQLDKYRKGIESVLLS